MCQRQEHDSHHAALQGRSSLALRGWHTESALEKLASFLKGPPGETRVLMENTGRYSEPIADYLHEAGLFVSVVNPILVHDYGTNMLRSAKTDKKDAVMFVQMAIDCWLDLKGYIPEDESRQSLIICNRQCIQYEIIKTMLRNNLIALLDQTLPDVNRLFSSPARKTEGHEKWMDTDGKINLSWLC